MISFAMMVARKIVPSKDFFTEFFLYYLARAMAIRKSNKKPDKRPRVMARSRQSYVHTDVVYSVNKGYVTIVLKIAIPPITGIQLPNIS